MKISIKKLRTLLLIVGISVAALVIGSAVSIVAWYQDAIVQSIVSRFNEDFKGALIIEDTDISPFSNFPYISIDIKNVQVFEDKADMFAPILDVSNTYLGLNFWALLKGDFKVNMLRIENGNFDIRRYEDGSLNLINALSGSKNMQELKETYNIDLRRIELSNLDIIKYDEASRYHVETYVEDATSRFSNSEELLMIALDSRFLLNVIVDGDSTMLTHKEFSAITELDYDKKSGKLSIMPTAIEMKNAIFHIEGSVDVNDEFDMDLKIHGDNPNFNLMIAMAPKELIPVLEQYENAGRIYFDVSVRGKTLGDNKPAIEAVFGCDSAYFRNPESKAQLEQIGFNGRFTNGENHDLSTMEFVLENVKAKPEAGIFNASLFVRNFETPEIDLTVNSLFDLNFLSNFLNVTTVQNLDGDVSLQMKFKDIIDLRNPERSFEEFNKSYFSEMDVKNLSFNLPDYHLKFDSIDMHATMDGNHANIDVFFIDIGNSDITIRGEIDDLPAIIHQSEKPVTADLFVYASLLDIKELTSSDTLNSPAVDESIDNMRLELAFTTTPKSLINFEDIPEGDFFIKNFYGKFRNYAHTFRKFNAHVIVGKEDLDVLEFNGSIDDNAFEYMGKIYNYPMLLADTIRGDLDIDFGIKSALIKLNDLFAIGTENYIPPDYRNEEISDIEMFGNARLTFEDSLISTKMYFDQLSAGLKLHEMELEDFHGKIRLLPDMFVLDGMTGSIGNTTFTSTMDYYLGENDSIRAATNRIILNAEMVDFDQLSNYSYSTSATEVAEDSLFNIYKIPFTDLKFAVNIDKLTYHKHRIDNVNADIRIQKNHFLYIDTLDFFSAGGHVDLKGYFDGSDPSKINFYPNMRLDSINLEEALFRFDNFDQEFLISENLEGSLSGSISGRVRMQADMMAQIDDSELYLDVTIINGQLKNYKPMESLSEYFKNKNLANIRFDTLTNRFEVRNGVITIPSMTINSSLGTMDISGTHQMDYEMEYYLRLPMKLVTQASWQKLFGRKESIPDSTHLDAIQYKNSDKKVWYVNLKLEGTPENYRVSLGRRAKGKG